LWDIDSSPSSGPYTRAQVVNQRVEATLRKQLVLAEDMGVPARAFSGYVPILASLLANYSNLLSSFFFFNVWVGSWQQAVVMVPFFTVGPRLFDMEVPITMGVLTQVSDAFINVFDSLSTAMDNWAQVNEFRSVLRRLREFEALLPPHGVTAEVDDARAVTVARDYQLLDECETPAGGLL